MLLLDLVLERGAQHCHAYIRLDLCSLGVGFSKNCNEAATVFHGRAMVHISPIYDHCSVFIYKLLVWKQEMWWHCSKTVETFSYSVCIQYVLVVVTDVAHDRAHHALPAVTCISIQSMQVIYMTMYVSVCVCVTGSFICESTSNKRVKQVCKDGKLSFTNKNVHIQIRDGGKRKSRCPCAFFSFWTGGKRQRCRW